MMNKIFNLKIVLCLILFGLSAVAFGQQLQITGTVVDENGQGMPAVNVAEKGTANGTITDMDGKYTIHVSSTTSTLVFSFIGYNIEEVVVGNQSKIDFTMIPSIENLEEVVVIGYGTMKKKDVTTSMVSLDGGDLTRETAGNIGTALQGKAPGVQVITNSGAPGATPKVLIRGFTSINSSTSPLYVVDGIPIVSTSGNGDVNFLSNDEIENIEVLKDASAAAIYGARASAGVILITTKRGKAGKTQYNFNLSYGLQQTQKPYDVMNSQKYAEAMNLSYANSDLDPMIDDTQNLNYTDWWSEGIDNVSPQMNASFSAAGGNENYKYNLALTYYDQQSFYSTGEWKRFTGRLNNDLKLANWLTVGIDLSPSYQKWDDTPSWYGDYLLIDPITPVYIPEDELTGDENEYSIYERSYYTYTFNPVAREARQKGNGGYNYGLASNGYIDLKPFKNFTFRSQGGLNIKDQTTNTFSPEFTIDASHEFASTTSISETRNSYLTWSWQNTATYNYHLDKHNGSLMVGMTSEKQKYNYVYAYAEGFPSTDEIMRELAAQTGTVTDVDGNESESSILSYLGRFTYNYDNRYLLTATGRFDGSSKFLPKNKWGFFPSASVAWRFSNEEFFKNYNFLSDGKLFAGWGTVGNQYLDDNAYLSTMYTDYYVFGDDATTTSVTAPSTYKNEDLKWETVKEQNIGIDLKFFDNTISATVEGYKKVTEDMLFKKTYAFYSGFPGWGSIWTNIGEMQALGLDISLGYSKTFNNFEVNVVANVSHAKMKMNDIGGSDAISGGDEWNSQSPTRMEVGEEPGYFYGYKTDGIFQNYFEVNSHTSDNGDILQEYARPGDIRFVDVNGDGTLDSDDRVKLGSPYADLTGGLSINLTYNFDHSGSIDFGTNLSFSYGNDAVNYLKYYQYDAVNQTNLADDALDKAWHGEGTSNDIPILSHNDLNENYTKFSDFYVEDASFIKLRNLQLGYSFSKSICNTLKLTNLRVYVSGQNLATWTKFTGVDPETDMGTIMKYGFASFSYPMQKTFVAGINVSF